EVWREALEEIVGEETPADRAWRERDEQVTLPLARFRYAAAAAAVVSLKRARRHARDWRDYPKSDAHEARGYAAFAIYDILADTLLALRATARNEARYERTSQHRRREQHRQTPPSPPECEDEGPGPVPDFSLPVPTRLLPVWRTYDLEEMSRLAKEGHESVNAWIAEEEAKKRKAEASGRTGALAALLNNPSSRTHDLLLLQEPPAAIPLSFPGWRLLSPPEPPAPEEGGKRTKIRSLLLLNDRLPPSSFSQLRINSPDVIGVDICAGGGEVVRVVGLYNPHSGDAAHNEPIILLPSILAAAPPPSRTVVLGDFNLRHPQWEPERTIPPTPAAETAITVLNDLDLYLLSPLGENTWSSHNGRDEGVLDLAFGDLRTSEELVSCKVNDSLHALSDHLPLALVLPLDCPAPPTPPPQWLFRKTQPTAAIAAFESFSLSSPPGPLNTAAEIDKEGEQLTSILLSTRDAVVRLARPGGKHRLAHAWWSDEIAEAVDRARKGDGTYTSSPHDKLHTLLPYLQPPPSEALDAVETTEEEPVDGLGGREGEEEAQGDDGDVLPWASRYQDEVRRALFAARPFAAAGPDTIPNHFLQLLWPSLRLRIVPLCAAILRRGHLPRSWRDATGIVLRKPKKPDYTHPKAYRLISFERTTAKLVKKIATSRLSYLAEKFSLLPKSHFGGRKGRAAVEAVAAAVDVIKRQHRNGNHFVPGLAVDIAGAFPSVSADQLDRNLRAKNVPSAARRFVRSWMEERTVTISLDGSSVTVPATGLPQGSALSPIAYCLYNAPALEAAEKRGRSCGFGWIDDLNLFAWGKTVSEAADNLRAIIPDLESWSSTHKSRFEPTKSDLVLVLPPTKTAPALLPTITLDNTALPYSPSLTMLGTILDERLTFEPHTALCAAKASTVLNGVQALLNAKSGVTLRLARELVEAVVEPRRDWMGAIWWRREGCEKKVKMLRAVQRESARLVSGCFRTTALDAMEVEAGLTPIEVALETASARLAIRALSAPPTHPLHTPTCLAAATPTPKHPSPLHTVLSSPFLPSFPQPLEQLDPEPTAPWAAWPRVETLGVTGDRDAREHHDRILRDLKDVDQVAYTDGSEMEGLTGAGLAIRLKGGDDELVGLNIAITAAPALFRPSSTTHSLTVFADNASAVDTPAHPRTRPAQLVRLDTLRRLHSLQMTHPNVTIRIVWRIARLPRPLSTLLIRLRCDFSALNASRLRTGVHVDGECESCGELETREHYLYHCPAYAQQRADLLSSLPSRTLPPLNTLLSSGPFLPALLSYITATDRFPSFHHPLQLAHTTTAAAAAAHKAPPLQRDHRNAATGARSTGVGVGHGGGPDWTAWVLADEARYPPLARARHAGVRAVLHAVKRRLSAAKQHAADVLSREETIAAEEAVQLWELLDDVAVRVTTTALDSVWRERLAQDARFVADSGPPFDPYRPFP
ncbi:hypothetical protein JCM8097_004729, partial [Rhodosporidiobolus ruineniae]